MAPQIQSHEINTNIYFISFSLPQHPTNLHKPSRQLVSPDDTFLIFISFPLIGPISNLFNQVLFIGQGTYISQYQGIHLEGSPEISVFSISFDIYWLDSIKF